MSGPPVLSEMPASFPANTTLTYSKSFADFRPQDGYSMALLLAGPQLLQVAATSDSSGTYTFTLTPGQTALIPGRYAWNEVATKGSDRYVAASGVVSITPNLAVVGANDMQSKEERWLAMVEAVLDNRMSADVQSYTIAGRQLVRMPVKELMSMRASLAATVELQKFPGRIVREVKVSFPRPI